MGQIFSKFTKEKQTPTPVFLSDDLRFCLIHDHDQKSTKSLSPRHQSYPCIGSRSHNNVIEDQQTASSISSILYKWTSLVYLNSM